MRLFEFIGNTKERTVASIYNFKENPLDSLGQIIPVLIGLTAFIGFIVAYVMFVVSGGYTNQLEYIKENSFLKEEAYTSGTVHIINQGIVSMIINALLCAQFVVIMITYFKREPKFMKAFAIIYMVLIGCVYGFRTILIAILTNKIILPDSTLHKMVDLLDKMNIESFDIVTSAAFDVILIGIILFLTLLLVAKNRWMVGHGTVAFLIAYVVFPLLLLCLENIIPLVLGVVFLVILGAVMWFIFGSIAGEGGSGGTYVSSVRSSGGKKSTSNEKNETVPEKNCSRITYLNHIGGSKLYKVHGSLHDYVELDNGPVAREICSLSDLEKGKYHIYDESQGGREVKSSEIPWRK